MDTQTVVAPAETGRPAKRDLSVREGAAVTATPDVQNAAPRDTVRRRLVCDLQTLVSRESGDPFPIGGYVPAVAGQRIGNGESMLLPTSLVGSYPQPEWLIDRERLSKQVPRVRMHDLWRVAPNGWKPRRTMRRCSRSATRSAPASTSSRDGEQRRESYSNRFATALEGIDLDNPGTTINRSGKTIPVPRVAGKIRRRHPVEVRDVEILRANTDRKIKVTVPGPFTMAQAGAGRLLQRRGRARDGLCGRRQRGDQGPVRGRRRHRADRRAVDAAASRTRRGNTG